MDRRYLLGMQYAFSPPVLDYFFYFVAMSLAGWLLETAYRSYNARRFVNAGFLSGPFVPIYGFACVCISLIYSALSGFSPILMWTLVLLIPTALEYLVGLAMERLFGLRLWDYRDERLNLGGRICLKFSIIWAALVAVLVLYIQPFVFSRVSGLGAPMGHFVAGALAMYFVLDTAQSAASVVNFRRFLVELREGVAQGRRFLPSLGVPEVGRRLPSELRRLLKPLGSFPALAREFRPNLHAFPEWIRVRFERRMGRK